MHFEILGSRTAAQIPTLRRGPLAPSRSASADALNALTSTKWREAAPFLIPAYSVDIERFSLLKYKRLLQIDK